MTVPAVPEPDDKDWTWVLERACPECGFQAWTVAIDQLSVALLEPVATLQGALARAGAGVRPQPAVWSPLEYACHVRDVCVLFRRRLTLMLDEDDPVFANWDQDETALAHRYWEQQPAQVAIELDVGARAMADTIASVGSDQWQRPGQRSNGSTFTVETLCRYFVHDLVHHAHDVTAANT